MAIFLIVSQKGGQGITCKILFMVCIYNRLIINVL